MSDNKRIAKNTIFLYIRMFLILGVNLYTSRVVLKVLGASDYGLFNVVGGLVTMFAFLNGSLGAATSRYITFELGKKDLEKTKEVFNVALLIHIAIALIIIILGETVGLWLFYEKMIIPEDRISVAFWVYQITMLSSFFTMTQVPYNATIIAHENMKVYAWVGLCEAFGKLIIVFMLAISPIDKLLFYALMLCVLQVLVIGFYRLYCNKHFPETKLKLYKNWKLYKEMFLYGSTDLIGNMSVMAQGQGINILLNMFFGPVVNAARGIAYQVQGAVTQFSTNFTTAVKPQLIKSYAEGNIDDTLRLMINSSCFSYYLLLLLCLPIMLETQYIVGLWLGEYPEHTIMFIHLVMILCLIQAIKTPRVSVFHATGHIKLSNTVVGLILCAALPLAYVFLKIGMAPESVFVAAIITMVLSEIVSPFILRRYVKFSIGEYFLKVHARCLLITAISAVVPLFLFDRFMPTSFVRLIFTCLLTTLSIGITVWTLGISGSMRNKLKQNILTKFRHGK